MLGTRIGGGGMGEVWRADDTVLGRTVAVKVLMPALSEDPTFAQRFQNEARAMATLTHPGVVDVYDYGICDVEGRRVSFLVMEHIQGESLDRVLRRRGPLGVTATMRLVAEVADALADAHAQGIVHRDVKPANLMVRPGGSVVLTDFGIAHSASAGQLTATGTMLCSAGYCAPEMATSNEVTPAVDVYALGVVAYECLSGHLPFQGDTPIQIIFKHLNAPTPRLPEDVPIGARQVVERALEKAPGARWLSAPQMAEAARSALASPATPVISDASGTVPASPVPTTTAGSAVPGMTTTHGAVEDPGKTTTPDRTAASRRRRRTLRAVITVSAAVLVSAAVAGFVWLRPTEQAARYEVPTPAVSESSPEDLLPTAPSSSSGRRHTAEPTKRDPTPRATRATRLPSPSPTVTTSSPPTESPSATPTTSEPEEPTEEPTTPGPEEPTAEPTITSQPGEIQCIRAPCP
uniref:non-specific serine/threonine protein kinase n=1 Tax=Nonomuraea gerenzanensis TaxID=93944 RepID=A0A1M4ELD9_9ACTN|nr:serine/threonine protein kinase [Nonomuraea gerenzanensis]